MKPPGAWGSGTDAVTEVLRLLEAEWHGWAEPVQVQQQLVELESWRATQPEHYEAGVDAVMRWLGAPGDRPLAEYLQGRRFTALQWAAIVAAGLERFWRSGG